MNLSVRNLLIIHVLFSFFIFEIPAPRAWEPGKNKSVRKKKGTTEPKVTHVEDVVSFSGTDDKESLGELTEFEEAADVVGRLKNRRGHTAKESAHEESTREIHEPTRNRDDFVPEAENGRKAAAWNWPPVPLPGGVLPKSVVLTYNFK